MDGEPLALGLSTLLPGTGRAAGLWCCSERTPSWVIAAGPSCLAQLPPLSRVKARSPSSWEPGHCEVHGPTPAPGAGGSGN